MPAVKLQLLMVVGLFRCCGTSFYNLLHSIFGCKWNVILQLTTQNISLSAVFSSCSVLTSLYFLCFETLVDLEVVFAVQISLKIMTTAD